MELLVYPAIYLLWKRRTEARLSTGVQESGATNSQQKGLT
jgi:hypothetical protein